MWYVYPSPPSRVRAVDVCVGVRFPSNPVFRLRLNRAVWLVIRTVVVTEEKLLNANVLDGMMLAGSDSLNTIQRVRDTPEGKKVRRSSTFGGKWTLLSFGPGKGKKSCSHCLRPSMVRTRQKPREIYCPPRSKDGSDLQTTAVSPALLALFNGSSSPSSPGVRRIKIPP